MAENNALARLQGGAGQMITSPQTLAEKIRDWSEKAHVLTPAVEVSAIAPQHAINVAVVVIDPRIDDSGVGAETYGKPKDRQGLPWLKDGERALGKVALAKIAAAMGISWDPRYTGRTDDRSIPNYWEYRAVGALRDVDGSTRTIQGTFELDLRDGAPATKGFTVNQLEQTRKSGLRICESKAMNAAIRTLGLKQKYTAKELEKPFVCLRTSFVPDMNDPEQRRLVAERALAGSSALYGQPRQLDAGVVIDVEPQPSTATSGHAHGPANTVDTSAGKVDTKTGEVVEEKPKAQEPTGPTISDIRAETGKTRDGGRPFTKHHLTLSDGRVVYTFHDSIAKQAEEFRKNVVPVEVVTKETRWGKEIEELTRATARLPLDEDGPSDADLSGDKY